MTQVKQTVIQNLITFKKTLDHSASELDIDRPIEWLNMLIHDNQLKSAHPYQRPRHYFPGLPDSAWHDPKSVPFCEKLENNAQKIASEYFGVTNSDPSSPYTQNGVNFITGTEWRAALLKSWTFKPEQCQIYPETSALLSDPDSAETAMFSVVKAGGKILPHCGPWNTRLTVHLGLSIPQECQIRVGDEIRTWEPGLALVFDDSFEHEVWNNSDQSRVILLVDVWHPQLNLDERAILQPMLKLLDDDHNDYYKVEDAIDSVKKYLSLR
ncbi:aspartyl/asparaginyl beta-hydroxylase domain-containing protein [Pseudomonas coronafaciens]|uniref:aspartyl/asparaginyl beta-hydroxylase domain-containing protein n=1 Tax=Pseudomonas coronafaciens TaxID=53409 RepID=UPI0006B50542|nr:aspartyl/asparaginyl beta-hydroxylase domain-containing protein [Pseudomonas coronafaciens]